MVAVHFLPVRSSHCTGVPTGRVSVSGDIMEGGVRYTQSGGCAFLTCEKFSLYRCPNR